MIHLIPYYANPAISNKPSHVVWGWGNVGMRFSMRIKFDFIRFCLAAIPLFICSRPFAAMTANFDTAWTFTYDGGLTTSGTPIPDRFQDIKILPNGDAICVGETSDTLVRAGLIIKLTPNGKIQKKGSSF